MQSTSVRLTAAHITRENSMLFTFTTWENDCIQLLREIINAKKYRLKKFRIQVTNVGLDKLHKFQDEIRWLQDNSKLPHCFSCMYFHLVTTLHFVTNIRLFHYRIDHWCYYIYIFFFFKFYHLVVTISLLFPNGLPHWKRALQRFSVPNMHLVISRNWLWRNNSPWKLKLHPMLKMSERNDICEWIAVFTSSGTNLAFTIFKWCNKLQSTNSLDNIFFCLLKITCSLILTLWRYTSLR